MHKTEKDIILMLGGKNLTQKEQMEYCSIRQTATFLRFYAKSEYLVPKMQLGKYVIYDDTDYFGNWVTLMKAVDFIENVDAGIYQVEILQEGCKILKRCKYQEDFDFTVGYLTPGTTKFEATYMAVAKFADYYNQKLL